MASDKFTIERDLGEGAFGKVYQVKGQDGQQYAMKIIDLSKSTKEEKELALKEAAVLKDLQHVNVLRYTDSFERDGKLCIVTEYCANGDLSAYLGQRKKQKLEEGHLIDWFQQITYALQYLHQKKIIHRDVKTNNVFLNEAWQIKLGDMGLAKVLERSSAMAVTFCGSPYYMSPELFSLKPYDTKSDIWALGVIVYEMSTLERPFNGLLIQQLGYKIVHEELPALPTGYSPGLNDLLTQMMQKDPKLRPSADDILKHDYFKGEKAVVRPEELTGFSEQFLEDKSIASDEFILERTLRDGSFGKIYEVKGLDGQQYAMKVIDLSKSFEAEELARKEAALLKKLQHVNILRYTDSFERDGALCIVTEYCANGDLSEYLDQRKKRNEQKLEEDHLIDWFRQITYALQHLHQKNIIHRNIQTSSVFLNEKWQVKLGDMGLAKVLERPNAKAVTFCGSPNYMSPEILTCRPYDSKIDIWALGVIIYEMATLERPFGGMLMHQQVFKIVHGGLPTMPTGYRPGLNELLTQIMEKNPELRPSADDILKHDYFKGAKPVELYKR